MIIKSTALFKLQTLMPLKVYKKRSKFFNEPTNRNAENEKRLAKGDRNTCLKKNCCKG